MAITFALSGSWAAANATTQTVTLPTHAAGDMLLVRVGMKHASLPGDITCNTSGWERIGQHNSGTGASSNGGGDVQVAVFWKIATSSSETNPVITYHASVAATPSAAIAVVYSKGSTEYWVEPTGAGGTVAAATSMSATMSSHISAAAGDWLDAFVVTNDNTTLTVPTVTQTGLTLAAAVETPSAALSSATSNDISADGVRREVTAGTSSAAAVFTGTNSVADIGAAWVTRLRVTTTATVTLDLLDSNRALYAPTLARWPAYSVVAYRWRNDDGNETGATWAEALDTPLVYTLGYNEFRLRVGIEDIAGPIGVSQTFTLEYRVNGGTWYSIGDPTDGVEYIDSLWFTSPSLTTQQITSGAFSAGQIIDNQEFGQVTFGTAGDKTEFEWMLAMGPVGAAVTEFRLYWDSGSAYIGGLVPEFSEVSSGPQTITLGLLDGAAALYAPTVQPDQFVTLGLLDGAAALYAPTVTPKNTVTLGLLDAGPALYAPTATTRNTVSLGLLDAGAALYAPTITPTNAITLGLLDAAAALYAPTLATRNTIDLGLLDAGAALYAPTVANAGGATQGITLALLDAGSALYAPTLLPTNTITLGLLDAANALYAPTTYLDQFVTLGLLDGAAALYAPTVTTRNTITLGLLDAGNALYAPTTYLDQFVTLDLIDAGSALYAPTISQTGAATQTITLALLDAAAALYAPTVIPGPVTVSLGLLDAGAALYAPTTYQDQFVTLGLIDGAAALYAPVVRPTNTLGLGLIDAAAALYAPTVAPGPVTLTLDLIDGAPALYAPTVANAGFPTQTLELGLLDGAAALYPPVLAKTIAYLTGFTRTATGQLLPGCVVHVFRTSDDVEIAQVTSNASAVYSVVVVPGESYYVVAYKAGSPDLAGTTVNTLQGV